MKCAWRRCDRVLAGRQRRFCSLNCKTKFFVARRRINLKAMAVGHMGGRCQLCGYDRCFQALTFHHVDEKSFGIAFKGYTRSWERVKAELENCLLVCANCHAELHAQGINAAPLGNRRVNNQVNSGKPSSKRHGNPEPSPTPMVGKVQRLERKLVPRKGEAPGSVTPKIRGRR